VYVCMHACMKSTKKAILCVYLCMHVCMMNAMKSILCVFMHVGICVLMNAKPGSLCVWCIHACVWKVILRVNVYSFVYVCMYSCTCFRVCMRNSESVYKHAYILACVCIYISA
jgi:hypothetical protein